MPIIQHKFRNHSINKQTRLLIIGTFNPDVIGNDVTFFYGRHRNFLWRYLPFSFGEVDLKQVNLVDKLNFMERKKVDFVDVIKTIDIEQGNELNFDDNYIDNFVIEWNNIIDILENNKSIKKVIFTRSTFNGIPNIYDKIDEIEVYCNMNEIKYINMISPARFWRNDRQLIWNNFINE